MVLEELEEEKPKKEEDVILLLGFFDKDGPGALEALPPLPLLEDAAARLVVTPSPGMKIDAASKSITTTQASAVSMPPPIPAAAALDAADAALLVALCHASRDNPRRKGTGASMSVSISIAAGGLGMYMCSHLRG